MHAFGQHYGIAVLPGKPYTRRHKGKIERGIASVQENALKGRTLASLAEQNCFLLDWEQSVADTRIHGPTRRQVGARFTAEPFVASANASTALDTVCHPRNASVVL
jgi:transposase